MNWINFNPKEIHHMYIGGGFILAGLLFYVAHLTMVGNGAMAAGAILVLDDLYQHVRQVTKPEYRSPINRLWAAIRGK